MKSFSKLILQLTGWKITGDTDLPQKCVICVAPHTSNWDLPLGLVVYNALGRKASFLIKKEWFFFPMNILFKALGGIPVDRSRKTSLTEQIVEIYNARQDFQLAITPEATRKLNTEWKKGFYFIALAAKVPIVIAALDYGKKEAIFKKVFFPTGNVDADIDIIKLYYKDITAKHPQYFSL
ncbi:1-acyl-sn-glycerol-3-phosphate acyltransferase [Dysgonomonas sp. Marseille-P4677]|uniref:1-acyl-sn-glycerol-3-phosphate acyltransferase n=1 Tax=Dysgonomonas sp. Marseille-P4677 TaxID=2364790 RepID=UPI00191232A6|nr:1-acyl-sn-glycerol-3-phosphate acyltransferase [Dysgonomonas sp. Marseille-P4677]MBK5721727.1 1-acyl-sn-glycerol-3-phosphate acyltransferase [Dysgonomonas sp. Marseille-P4677]